MINIEDLRKRHANSILNTATGRALGAALDELERLREPRKRDPG
jgi:DNA-binding IclR family transcriptional regulator